MQYASDLPKLKNVVTTVPNQVTRGYLRDRTARRDKKRFRILLRRGERIIAQNQFSQHVIG